VKEDFFKKDYKLAGLKVDDSLLRDPANCLIAKTKLFFAFSLIKEAVNRFIVVSPLEHQE